MSLKASRFIVALMLFAAASNSANSQGRTNVLSPEEAAHGWKLIFDGSSLAEWQPYSTFSAPATGDWVVKDGAIFCPGTTSGWLATNDTFSNFELRLQFRGGEKVNSGVFLRSDKDGAPHKTGYELQIWDYQPAGYSTGSLVGYVKAPSVKIIPDEWNDYDITVNGDHFTVVLNGKLCWMLTIRRIHQDSLVCNAELPIKLNSAISECAQSISSLDLSSEKQPRVIG